jgi:hypothetical protein
VVLAAQANFPSSSKRLLGCLLESFAGRFR